MGHPNGGRDNDRQIREKITVTIILPLILALGLLIFVHELGHFVVAKAVGVRVLKFSLGFGRSIVSFQKGDTEYAIGIFPFGGYVKMAGEEPEELPDGEVEEKKWEPGDYMYASVPRRLAIITAGPVMNIMLALLIYFGGYSIAGVNILATTTVGAVEAGSVADAAGFLPGDTIVSVDGDSVGDWAALLGGIQMGIGVDHLLEIDRNRSRINLSLPSLLEEDGGLREGVERGYGLGPVTGTRLSEVADSSVAAAAGLEAGDRIVSYGGREIENWHELSDAVHASPGEAAELKYLREGELITVIVTPEPVFIDSTGETVGMLGITSDPTDLPFMHISLSLPQALSMATRETWETGTMVVDILARLISGQLSMKKTMGGPVTIVAMATRSARSGLLSLLLFVAFVSVNLGVLNLLPIPVLDGGHLVFLGFEALRGRPLSVKVRLMATQVGMAFIILIMLYVTVNDFLRLL